MALKRRTKVSAEFGMASMTDIIFLLLLFFMITSTVVQTNAIKVLLPQSSKTEQQTEKTIVRIVLDAAFNYSVARDNEKDNPILFEEIEAYLQNVVSENPEMYVALYADETVPYREIVKILDVANKNKFKLVLATRPLEQK